MGDPEYAHMKTAIPGTANNSEALPVGAQWHKQGSPKRILSSIEMGGTVANAWPTTGCILLQGIIRRPVGFQKLLQHQRRWFWNLTNWQGARYTIERYILRRG
jgi:hypothetical protein